MKKLLIILLLASVSCSRAFTEEERNIIGNGKDGLMRVLKTDSEEDMQVLRGESRDLSSKELRSPEYANLCRRMLLTVNDPACPGVGIAAPQVGLNVNLIAVERYDREKPEFGFYANVRIDEYSDSYSSGREGCLSVPDLAGTVSRADSITVSYTDPETLERKTERVGGYTAVIFQHETDHLNGIIYTDRADSLYSRTH